MAGGSLLALIDDIASVLDDIALLTKVATKKASGILGDDLALNAQQVIGVRADRELPIIWAVCKGSFLNKFILVPLALGISATIPQMITPLLMIGGAYLCFEGFEKIWNLSFPAKVQHKNNQMGSLAESELNQTPSAGSEPSKIKGAIRTDFILSAEIIAITLGTLQESSMAMQAIVLTGVAIIMTIGVYGFVALIVKVDDLGLFLITRAHNSKVRLVLGHVLLKAAPLIMKFLSVAGTMAMFLVGGGIFKHGIPWLHSLDSQLNYGVLQYVFDGLLGLLVGFLIFLLMAIGHRKQRTLSDVPK